MPSAPTGRVVLVFTDVVASARLWEQDRDAVREALSRHDAVLRDQLDAADGYEVKTEGDAFMIAFAAPTNAIRFCCEAQAALHRASWPAELTRRPRRTEARSSRPGPSGMKPTRATWPRCTTWGCACSGACRSPCGWSRSGLAPSAAADSPDRHRRGRPPPRARVIERGLSHPELTDHLRRAAENPSARGWVRYERGAYSAGRADLETALAHAALRRGDPAPSPAARSEVAEDAMDARIVRRLVGALVHSLDTRHIASER